MAGPVAAEPARRVRVGTASFGASGSANERGGVVCGEDFNGEHVMLGAKLGAILCGHVWTVVDAGGHQALVIRAVWTAVDACGHGLEIYGSGGWGFEFLRAC